METLRFLSLSLCISKVISLFSNIVKCQRAPARSFRCWNWWSRNWRIHNSFRGWNWRINNSFRGWNWRRDCNFRFPNRLQHFWRWHNNRRCYSNCLFYYNGWRRYRWWWNKNWPISNYFAYDVSHIITITIEPHFVWPLHVDTVLISSKVVWFIPLFVRPVAVSYQSKRIVPFKTSIRIGFAVSCKTKPNVMQTSCYVSNFFIDDEVVNDG